jgi:uncharacterized phiE125 gp8 family phage protein
MSYLKLIAPPAADKEPVTLNDAKATLRVDHADDDDRIQRHIREARDWVETRIQTKLAPATWEIALDEFPSAGLNLTIGPVQSVTSIKYDDVAPAEQTILSSDYALNDATIYPDTAWPVAFKRPIRSESASSPATVTLA